MKQGIKTLSPSLFNFGDNWEDFYLELKSIKRGDIFYECSTRSGENYELRAIEDAKKTKNGWICKAKTNDNKIVELYVSANTTYNGPNLFWAPQNLSQLESGRYAYLVK